MLDAIIVGGGPAGLSAALILGRCRRRVALYDAGNPRNSTSSGLHGFLSRDGIHPAELLQIGRDQLLRYPSVEFCNGTVVDAAREGKNFRITLDNGASNRSRKLLLATGVVDSLSPIPGLRPFYGKSVFHCPYCDGWEMRDQPLAIYGKGSSTMRLALELKVWSDNLVLCSDGPVNLSPEEIEKLSRNRIPLREDPILRLEGSEGVLEQIVFTNGQCLKRRGMFLSNLSFQRSKLPEKLGCALDSENAVKTGKRERTHLPGLYVAGDASREGVLAIGAAAEGAEAAFAMNRDLLDEDLL